MYHGIFIDERKQEQQYALRLSEHSAGKLGLAFRQPDLELADLADVILASGFKVIAIDFRLDEIQIHDDKGNVTNRYKASVFAQHFRDRVLAEPDKDVPLVLVSQENFITEFYEPDLTAKDLFDLVISKNDVNEDPAGWAKRIVCYIDAYEQIKVARDHDGTIKLTSLLHTKQEETDALLLPHREFRELEKIKYPHQVASRLYKLLISRSGLLLSDEDLLSRLGVDTESAGLEDLFQTLEQAHTKYTGIFSCGWSRWWWHRVDEWARNLLGDPLGSLNGNQRVTKLNEALAMQLSAAESRWTHLTEEYFWAACASCHKPTEPEHSVLAFDTHPYPFLDRRRICWVCVQTGMNLQKGIEVDDTNEGIAKKLADGKITQTER